MKRHLILLSLLMGLLSACGTTSSETPASPPTEVAVSAPTEVSTATPVPTDPPTDQPSAQPATEPAQVGSISFVSEVLPILESRCVNCHGGQRLEEGLNLKTYADLMAGSDNGPVLVAGNADASLLAKLLIENEMPKRGPKLTPPQVQLIVDWINQGALNN